MIDLPEWKLKYILERIEGELVLDPPNEFVWSIRDLTFGMREYSEESETHKGVLLWSKYQRPRNWRELVGDKYADMPIASDIDHAGSFLPFGEIYDPYNLEDVLIRHPTIVRQVNELSRVGFRRNELRPLKITVSNVFRTAYRQLFLQAYEEARAREAELIQHRPDSVPVPTWFDAGPEPQWKQACKQFDLAVELISLFLCRHFTLYRNHWTPLLAEHADMSRYHKFFTTKGLAPRRPMPLE